MHDWEVVCAERDDESPHDDCRALEAVGILVANNVRLRKVDTVHVQLADDEVGYYVDVDGRRVPLQPARDDGRKYVRTMDEDTPEDPLASLPTRTAFEQAERFQSL